MKACRLATLGDVCAINPPLGRAVPPDLTVSFVPMQAVDELSGAIRGAVEGKAGEVRDGRTAFLEGDVLFAKITPSMQNGKSAVARGLTNGVGFGSTEFHVFRPGSSVLPEWVHAFLRRRDILDRAQDAFRGSAGQQRVPAAFLAALEVPVPPIQDQRRLISQLTALLAVVDKAGDAAKVRKAQAAALQRVILNNAFDEEARRSPSTAIADVTRIQTGYAFESSWFRPTGVRLLRNANIGHGIIDWTDTARLDTNLESGFAPFRLRSGDLVLSLDRPLVRGGIKVARLQDRDTPALLLQRVARFVLGPRVTPEYLYRFLFTDAFIAAIKGHDQSLGVPHVSPRQVGAAVIPIPSVERQRHLTAALEEQLDIIDSMTKSVDAELKSIEALSAVLLRQVFANLEAA